MISLRTYSRDQQGASAVEFALVIPMFLALVLGVVHMSFVLYAATTLHYAVESTARCLAVSANNPVGATTSCPSTAQVQTYGTSFYTGPHISPTFSIVSGTTCSNGQQVSGTGTYNMAMGFVSVPFSLSAKACFAHS